MSMRAFFANISGSGFNISSLSSKFAGWWLGDESTYILDNLNSGQDREALGGTLFPGRAILYDGVDQNSIYDDDGALNATVPLSFSCWVKPKTLTGYAYNTHAICGRGGTSFTSGRYFLAITSGGQLSFTIHTSAGIAQHQSASGVAVDTWVHVVCIIGNDGNIHKYHNGVEVNNIAFSGTFAAQNTEKFRIGSLGDASGYINCEVRDVRLFLNKHLTPSEVATIYDGGYVSGFTEWWMCSDSSTTRLHSAKVGGGHATNANFDGASFVTGYYKQPYNIFGYAVDGTYGQIPPAMSSASPTLDCYGNALTFTGQAKYNLSKSGADFVMFSGAQDTVIDTLINSCDLIGLNTWFSSGVGQVVTPVAFCGSRQFYNSTRKELIVIKEGEHLSATEEANLMSYMGVSASHSYHANSTALFARFTNSYTDKEKSRIDNVMRLLVSSGIYTELEVFVLSATSGLEEQLLDWMDAANNLVPANPTSTQLVTQQPYRGFAGQNDCYKSTFNPSTAAKFLQNDCFMAFKHSEAVDVPFGGDNGGMIAGVYNAGVSNVYAQIYSVGRNVLFYLNSNGASVSYDFTTPIDTSRTYLGNRTASNLTKLYAQRLEKGTNTAPSAARPNSIVYYGGAKLISENKPINGPALNWTQNIAYGGALTATQASLYTAIIDNFCDGQRALITDEWIYDTGCKYQFSNKCFIDRFGDKVIWGDYFNLYYSADGGTTVTGSVAWNYNTLGWPHMAHIFDNGKIIFATNKNKIYKTTTANFSAYSEMTPTKNGSTYTLHTPSNATYPGEYYKFLGPKIKQYLGDGTEIFVWNNYGLSLRGAAPGIVWYSFGDEIKVAFEMGTNPYTRDNGGSGGGTTGTFLGDAAVNYWVRHGHGVQQQSDDDTKFISMWGDLDRNALSPALSNFQECQFFRHTYTQGTDTWSSAVIKQGGQSSRWKATSGQMPGDGYIYWTSDAGIIGGNEAERGYFKSLIANLGDGSETRFYNPIQDRPSNMFHLDSDGFFMGGGYAATGGSAYGGFFGPTNIIWSDDMVTFNELTLKIPGNTYIVMIIKISTKRYMLNIMSDYDYFLGAQSVIIDFN